MHINLLCIAVAIASRLAWILKKELAPLQFIRAYTLFFLGLGTVQYGSELISTLVLYV